MIVIKQLSLDKDARYDLGFQYMESINDTLRARQVLLTDTWDRAQLNYEGKAPERTFPWKHASNAVVPITATHTDAIFARLFNTAVGQDPIFYVEPWGNSEVVPGITAQEVANHLTQLSVHVEKSVLKLNDVLEIGLMTMVKFGDVVFLLDWERLKETDFDFDTKTGEFVRNEDVIVRDGPVIRPIHPEDVVVPTQEYTSDAIQEAQYVAYRFWLDKETLEQWVSQGFYDEEEAEDLRAYFKGRNSVGDGAFQDNAKLLRSLNETIGTSSHNANAARLEMYHVFARHLFEGDDCPTQINFHVHALSKRVPFVAYNHWAHKKRILNRMNYRIRPGSFYSIGIPEMLFNIQPILDQTMRDILDNNKVQNTKAFLARAGGPIPANFDVFPSRIIYVNDLDRDFRPIDLGSGQPITSIQDIMYMQGWGERRTGITDTRLGQESHSRTPATSTLALLEESNKMIETAVTRMRSVLDDMWEQVMVLYFQFADFTQLEPILGARGVEVLSQVQSVMTPKQLASRMYFRSRVSTQNLNRSVRRQEALALFGQTQQYYGAVLQLAQMYQQTQDPALKQLLGDMLQGGHEVNRRFLDSLDIKDQSKLNPNFVEIVGEINDPDLANFALATETSGRSSQAEAALSAVSGMEGAGGPLNPPGRPEPGQARPNSELAGFPG